MSKEFFTEKEIEDLYKQGVRSLKLSGNVVLTELAYEKAHRLGLHLIQEQPDNPPSAPVRPYLVQTHLEPAGTSGKRSPAQTVSEDLQTRIRQAVSTRLGNKIEADLLEDVIHRVLKSTGLK